MLFMLETKWISDFNPCEGSEPSQVLICLIPKTNSFHV